jgi:hypothetical protein
MKIGAEILNVSRSRPLAAGRWVLLIPNRFQPFPWLKNEPLTSPSTGVLFPQQTCQASVRKNTLNRGGFFIARISGGQA